MIPRGKSPSYRFKEIIDLEAPIIPGQSIGGISLQMNFSQIKDYIIHLTSMDLFKKEKEDKIVRSQVRIGIEVEYSLYDGAVNFVVDILSGNIIEVRCEKGYKGKFVNTIGVGSPLHELLKLGESFDVYNTYYIMSPQFPGLYVELPEGYYDYDGELKDLPNYSIEAIGIFTRSVDGEDFYSTLYGESFGRYYSPVYI